MTQRLFEPGVVVPELAEVWRAPPFSMTFWELHSQKIRASDQAEIG
jgi:hypothetical protein